MFLLMPSIIITQLCIYSTKATTDSMNGHGSITIKLYLQKGASSLQATVCKLPLYGNKYDNSDDIIS